MVIFSFQKIGFLLICAQLLAVSSCGVEKGPLQYQVVQKESQEEVIVTANPLLLQSALKELLIPRCQMCHPWFRDENKINQRILAGEPLKSALYLRIEDGTMPPYGASFTNEELTRVFEAIEALKGPSIPDSGDDYEH